MRRNETTQAMVVLRESPRVPASPDASRAAWPPKSPFQALLSSPSGRKKWQDHQSRFPARSISPSPTKVAMRQISMSSSESDEADEELRLEEIALRRKQKEIERKRQRGEELGQDEEDEEDIQLKLDEIKIRLKQRQRLKDKKRKRQESVDRPKHSRAQSETHVQVPMSPAKERAIAPQEQLSPARKRLGLDTTAGASNVSLKRARDGQVKPPKRVPTKRPDTSRPKSFTERLQAGLKQADEKEAKAERIERGRSKTFSTMQLRPSSGGSTSRPQSQRSNTDTSKPDDKDEASYEPFSELHLSKRNVPHALLARELETKQIYTLPRLLKEVVSPDYEPPDCEEDIVILAILASKSSPYDQAFKHKTSETGKPQIDADAPRNKFMVLKLCDLAWEIDLFLFDTGFDQFWKLTPGTLLAILNPGIMPPKGNRHSGKFSLKLSSSDDKIMEIGTARDLGYCTSIKKDGQPCNAWIDRRSTEICEFHLNLFVEKQRKERMEVNTMWRRVNAGGKGRAREKRSSTVTNSREHGTLYHHQHGLGGSAASLLDAEDSSKLTNLSTEEASRKRLAAAQKERDLQRALDKMPSSVGKEYMLARSNSAMSARSAPESGIFQKPKAAELRLLANDASRVQLSAAKDRKFHFGLGAVPTTGREAVGWGGARKSELLRVKTPETEVRQTAMRPLSRDSGVQSPSKKARFMIAGKGIREPGRESGCGADLRFGDDDDELDIV
ncbi:hypothetical protein K470DRAFT_254679 [Piedraia hortae CBS 480.64]|uniref:Uncharacterized protein n=1 Tax=Piedraia hortae CBS 480.64 TaxID=1314780 RepID=A0A6A7C966_9PEZI|nr:hypothetical protein K470DRAFT_254679 [Piedraia hortae CBS 480.64]